MEENTTPQGNNPTSVSEGASYNPQPVVGYAAEEPKKSKWMPRLVVIIILVVIGFGGYYFLMNPDLFGLPQNNTPTPSVAPEKSVYRNEDVVVGKYVIPQDFDLPERPVFYVYQAHQNSEAQLWVMSGDGTNKKNTGVTSLIGSIHNVENYGGVLYAVDDSEGDFHQKDPKIYYYMTENRKTVAVSDIRAESGSFVTILHPVLSPSRKFIAFEHSKQQAADRMDDIKSYYVFDLSTGKSVELAEFPTGKLKWVYNEDSLYIAKEDGYYTYSVVTNQLKEIVKNETLEIFPGEENVEIVSENLYLRMINKREGNSEDSRLLGRLELSDGTVVEPDAEFSVVQPFFCFSADRKSFLYSIKSGDGGDDSEAPSNYAIKLYEIDAKNKRIVTPENQTEAETYESTPCYWTGNETVIVEKYIERQSADDYLLDAVLVEINVRTAQTRELTDVASGNASFLAR